MYLRIIVYVVETSIIRINAILWRFVNLMALCDRIKFNMDIMLFL